MPIDFIDSTFTQKNLDYADDIALFADTIRKVLPNLLDPRGF